MFRRSIMQAVLMKINGTKELVSSVMEKRGGKK